MSKIKPRAGIMDIPLYQGGAAHVEGVSNVVKLSSNENPFGPSPTAVKAYEAGARSLHRYPSADHAELRNAIAEAMIWMQSGSFVVPVLTRSSRFCASAIAAKVTRSSTQSMVLRCTRFLRVRRAQSL